MSFSIQSESSISATLTIKYNLILDSTMVCADASEKMLDHKGDT